MNLLKELLHKNKTLKIVSLIFGFAVWSLLSDYQTSSRWIDAPVYFYNTAPHMKVAANQDTIRVHIRGKIADLQACDDIGLHIDATNFKEGVQRIVPSAEQLFLPNCVTLVHNKPLFLEITTTVV